jgi:renierapurpurin 18,18'-hydroxylase
MELATTLSGQTVQNQVREIGINPNYWYAIGWAHQIKLKQIMPVEIWKMRIAIFRDVEGKLHAIEDACPHKGIALHKGQVQGCHIACPYHGWEFDGAGNCVNIPYLPENQKLPRASARTYPVQEKYGIIWLFPGDPSLTATTSIPHIAEFDEPKWLMVPLGAHFNAHFSICNENTMDVFHGFLHRGLQGWFDPRLTSLKETENSIAAEYLVSYKGRMAKFLGLSDRADTITTLPISIRYEYPNYSTSLQGVSALYLMRLPVSEVESRSFALFFFKINLPQWLLERIRPWLAFILEKFVLRKFLAQDIEMIESEQQTYLANPTRRYVEINPAIIALQRLLVKQYDRSQKSEGRMG